MPKKDALKRAAQTLNPSNLTGLENHLVIKTLQLAFNLGWTKQMLLAYSPGAVKTGGTYAHKDIAIEFG